MSRQSNFRRLSILLAIGFPAIALLAQNVAPAMEQAPSAAPTDMGSTYLFLGLATLQVLVIMALSSILSAVGGNGSLWAKALSKTGMRAVMLPALLSIAVAANAQEFRGADNTIQSDHLTLLLLLVNAFLFVVILTQLLLLKKLSAALVGKTEAPLEEADPVAGPSWIQRMMAKMTRHVPVEREQDIVMNHEYDGIRELDNSLPPWWVWLFYGTIIWGVVYIVNVHVIKIWPDQATEYRNEMAQAKADVDAYLATMADQVDENTVTQSTDPGMIAQGAAIYAANCTPCHGAALEGKEGLGPNLTDDYWKHGGGVKDIFRTIKYGVPEKGMISWKAQLKPIEIASLTDLILSKHGSDPPNAKAPEGDLWQGAKTDSTSNPAAKDTLRTAALP
ncbi:MAG: c-type cytochrome [Flavobacteriales bacterium]|nr:c-type cytochrome [Flavobacteriales bacterium]